MMRLNKFACLAALVVFSGLLRTASAQIQGNGLLLVDLRADDFTSLTTQNHWVNHGNAGLGDFFTTAGAVTIADPTVGTFDVTRGMYFDNVSKSFLCASPAPATLLANDDWAIEMWLYSTAAATGATIPTNTFAKAAAGWGDRPTGVLELDYGGGPSCLVTYQNGDNNFGTVPTAGRWHYVVWTHNGDGSVVGPANLTRVYVDGTTNTTWTQDYFTNDATNDPVHGGGPVATDDNPIVPISVGGIRDFGTNGAGISSWDTGGQAGGAQFSTTLNAGVNRVRIWAAAMTYSQQLNNYNLEKGEFVPKVFTVAPQVVWRQPLSGKVIDFGDATAPNTVIKPIQFTNLSGATSNYNVTSYNITGPDAARFTMSPASPYTGVVAVGQFVDFNLTFTPTSAIETTATLVVHTSAGDQFIGLRANQARIYADFNNGNDSNAGTAVSPVQTIPKALALATRPGDVIQLQPASYATFGAIANGDRQLRIMAPGGALVTNSSNLSQTFTSNLQVNPSPPPYGVFPSAPYFHPNNTTLLVNGVTFDSHLGTNPNNFVLCGAGTGTFDMTAINCKFYKRTGGGGSCFGVTGAGPAYTRVTAQNCLMTGGSTNTAGIRSNGLAGQLVAIGCDLRGCQNGIVFSSTAEVGSMSVTGCLMGSDRAGTNGNGTGRPTGEGININSAALFNGSTIHVANCTFDGGTDAGIAAFNEDITGDITGCTFANYNGWGYYNANFSTGPSLNPNLAINNCTFKSRSDGGQATLSALRLSGNTNVTITGCTFFPQGGNGVRIEDNSIMPTTVTLVACVIDGGTTTSAPFGGDPAAIQIRQSTGTLVRVDRCTISSTFASTTSLPTFTNALLPPLHKGSGIFVTGPQALEVSNSVIDGATFPIRITNFNPTLGVSASTTGTLVSSVKVYNNTIVASGDLNTTSTPTVVRVSNPNQTMDLENNIMLGYGTNLTNATAVPTLVTNLTTATPDPNFVTPNPFAVPAKGGISNYHLKSGSPAIGAGTPIAPITVDRDNVDRTTGNDQGAYQFNPAPNPVRHDIWTWF